LGALVSSEALDALNTIQVSKIGPKCCGIGSDRNGLVSDQPILHPPLSPKQVLKLASAGNPMAEDFVDKLEHHLRTIIRQAEGERHWPDKYRVYFKVRFVHRCVCA
jgi:hypothetical protein